MDVIAGRKTVGQVQGAIYANGQPVEQRSWSRCMGYVEQTDVHSPGQTVREALWTSARLRLPASVGDTNVHAFVDEVLAMLAMAGLQHALVGSPGGAGLSVEQRKRLTIAVELVANPPVIFMDEPTSGLDARAAATIMSAIRAVGDNGRTVVVTIHQPSIDIFEAFDRLLLIQRGGQTASFGDLGLHSCRLVEYLMAVPGGGSCCSWAACDGCAPVQWSD
jgi:ABC-type multidrug transport system ATPase subunit